MTGLFSFRPLCQYIDLFRSRAGPDHSGLALIWIPNLPAVQVVWQVGLQLCNQHEKPFHLGLSANTPPFIA